MVYPRHIVAVAGLVRDEAGRILLVKTKARGWEMPGGQVEGGEDVITALKREVFEESGCHVAVAKLVGVQSNVGFPPKLMLTFACQYIGGDLCPSEETPEVGWFCEAEALTLVQNGAQLDKLIDGLSSSGVTYRKYITRPYLVQLEAVI